MSLRLEDTFWLYGLLLIVPIALIAWNWFGSMTRLRRASAVLTRLALIALILGALAGATNVRRTERLGVIAIVDVSGSVRKFANAAPGADLGEGVVERVRAWIRDASRERGPEDLLGLVLFDGRAVAAATARTGDVSERLTWSELNDGTDLGAALELGAAMRPPEAELRLLVFSDGNETLGDASRLVRELGTSGSLGSSADASGSTGGGGIPIDVVPIAYRVQSEVIVESVDVPPRAPEGATVPVRVVLDASAPATGTLRLLREGVEIDLNGSDPGLGRPLTLEPGRRVEVVQTPLGPGRIQRFRAIFEPDEPTNAPPGSQATIDTVTENNTAEAFTLTPGRGAVLIVDGVDGGRLDGRGAYLATALAEAEFDVVIEPPGSLSGDLLELQRYDLVVLQNVGADEVSRQAQDALAYAVTEMGAGLVMVGGPASFAAGGWKGTPIEPILPVSLDLPQRLIQPKAAVAIVLDRSGSMARSVLGSSRSQQRIANEGAALAIESLDATDLVSVISFSTGYTVEQPIGPNDDAAGTARRVRGIASGGGTNLGPAMREAYRQLRSVKADIKHVIVLSDGQSMPPVDALPVIAGQMASDGIGVTTIAMGDDADDTTMKAMAEKGGGEFYRVTNPNVLPRVFVRAVRVVRTPMIREQPFDPIVADPSAPVLGGLTSAPTLAGLVLTEHRADPTVTTPLIAPGPEGRDVPLLAYWNAGLGRVGAFTSDAHDNWAASWLAWDGYATLWAQLARATARPEADPGLELVVEAVGDELRLRLEAADNDGAPLDLLDIPVTAYAPGGERTEARLVQTGPGVYEASVPTEGSGNYVVTARPRQGGRALSPIVAGASRPRGVEYRDLTSNEAFLRRLARETGGRVFDLDSPPTSGELWDRAGIVGREARLPMWRTLVLWAVVVLLLDVATRRIAWDRAFSKEYGAQARREAAEAVRDRGGAAAAAMGRLRSRTDKEQADVVEAPKLSQADALRLVREAKATRRQRRADEKAAASAAPIEDRTSKPRPDAPGEGAGGLLAAKRRAQERFEQEQGPDDDNATT